MKNIILFGGGNHISYCIDIIENEKKYNIIGIADPYILVGTEIMGYKVIGKQEEIKDLIKKYHIDAGLITIGDNWTRKIVMDIINFLVPGFEFVSVIHPSVIIGKHSTFGKGTVMMAGSIVSTNSSIGEFCFLASGAFLGPDCIMGNFSSLSAGSVTGGRIKIGEYTAITLGVTLFDRIEIGDHSVIGGGSLVTKSIPSFVIAYGNPAKVIKERKIGDKYLK